MSTLQRRPRVYLANTGGTIGMNQSVNGYRPEPGFLQKMLDQLPELHRSEMPEVVLEEYDPLLDSADMNPRDWLRIASDIVRRYDEFDAFVILHGTDTMAYTASALSYMFKNLTKTVILTGSQIPLREVRNDARDNLISSLLIAAHIPVPEVCIFFDQVLLRGNRTQKVNANQLDAFDSPNFPHLGQVGVEMKFRRDLILPPAVEPMKVRPIADSPFVGQIRLFPGISTDIVRNFLRPPIQGLVMETYGLGNAPARNKELIEAIREASDRGVVIVSVTQCQKGTVHMPGYETGRILHQAGVISGLDMTPEAALTKLFYLFTLSLSPEDVRRLMQRNLRGELTPPGSETTHSPLDTEDPLGGTPG